MGYGLETASFVTFGKSPGQLNFTRTDTNTSGMMV